MPCDALQCPAMPCNALRCPEPAEGSLPKGACRREPAEGSLPKGKKSQVLKDVNPQTNQQRTNQQSLDALIRLFADDLPNKPQPLP